MRLLEQTKGNSRTFDVVMRAITALLVNTPSYCPPQHHIERLLNSVRLEMHESSRQPIMFELVQAVIARKFKLAVIYDIVDQLQEVLIQSQSDAARKHARETLLVFLQNCEVNSKRVLSHITFLLTNLAYKFPEGKWNDKIYFIFLFEYYCYC